MDIQQLLSTAIGDRPGHTLKDIGNGNSLLTTKCSNCEKEQQVKLNTIQYYNWLESNKPIQNMISNLTPDDREILITGICGKCYDVMFNLDEE